LIESWRQRKKSPALVRINERTGFVKEKPAVTRDCPSGAMQRPARGAGFVLSRRFHKFAPILVAQGNFRKSGISVATSNLREYFLWNQEASEIKHNL